MTITAKRKAELIKQFATGAQFDDITLIIAKRSGAL